MLPEAFAPTSSLLDESGLSFHGIELRKRSHRLGFTFTKLVSIFITSKFFNNYLPPILQSLL